MKSISKKHRKSRLIITSSLSRKRSILGTSDGVAVLAEKLVKYGMGDVLLYVGENLSYENEKIFVKPASELTEYKGDPLSVICAVNENAGTRLETHGIRDEEFIRGKAPMTKEEVRTVSLSKLRLTADSVCYDVGAGTGSLSIEMALRAHQGQVWAIEKKEDAVELIHRNKVKFAADNLEIVLRFRLFHHLMVHDKVAHKMRGRRHGPRHRVREEQHEQRAVHLEDRQDPHHTQRTRTCKRYNHRHDRIPHTAQNTHMRVHNAAKEVRYAHNEHTLQTVLDNLRVRRIYRK